MKYTGQNYVKFLLETCIPPSLETDGRLLRREIEAAGRMADEANARSKGATGMVPGGRWSGTASGGQYHMPGGAVRRAGGFATLWASRALTGPTDLTRCSHPPLCNCNCPTATPDFAARALGRGLRGQRGESFSCASSLLKPRPPLDPLDPCTPWTPSEGAQGYIQGSEGSGCAGTP